MPRAEVGTPKWVANKMKAKGLQRLRWFCQMCEKQCRDENGFKCHRMSEGHQRQMQVFAQRAGRYMDEFSRSFEATFMQLMRTRYCRTKVLANTVYCDLIADKQHTHMNATIWTTLSEFVLYLDRSGKCKVEKTERGWVVEYIDREKIRREEEIDAKRKAELTAEQRREKQLSRQVEGAWEEKRKEEQRTAGIEEGPKPFPKDNSQPIVFKVSPKSQMSSMIAQMATHSTSESSTEQKIDFRKLAKVTATENAPKQSSGKRKLTVLEKLMLEDQERKKKRV